MGSGMSACAIPTTRSDFLLSRARAPDCIEADDIMEFTLEGEPVDAKGRAPYLERFIHGGALRGAARRAFGGAQPFAERDPVRHHQATSSSRCCTCAPISATTCRSGIRTTSSATPRCWSRTWRWGATSPRRMGAGRTILMRGHGATVLAPNIRHAVFISVYLEVNAKLQMQAMAMGDIKFLTPGEVDKIIERTGPYTHQPRLGKLVPPRRPPGDGPGVGGNFAPSCLAGADVLYAEKTRERSQTSGREASAMVAAMMPSGRDVACRARGGGAHSRRQRYRQAVRDAGWHPHCASIMSRCRWRPANSSA